MSGMVSPVRSATWLRSGRTGCAARSPPAVRRGAVADELVVLLLRGACPLAGALQHFREEGAGWAQPRGTHDLDGQEDGFRTVLLTRPRMGAFSYFLRASLIFAPAILVSPLIWSPRPSAFRRDLPVARPTAFLAPPFTASALCASFLKILTGVTFRGVILLARTRQPGHSGPGVPAVAARGRAGRWSAAVAWQRTGARTAAPCPGGYGLGWDGCRQPEQNRRAAAGGEQGNGHPGELVQCLRRTRTTSTMITMITMVPKPINMGYSSRYLQVSQR
jgi:hypothetical protein